MYVFLLVCRFKQKTEEILSEFGSNDSPSQMKSWFIMSRFRSGRGEQPKIGDKYEFKNKI